MTGLSVPPCLFRFNSIKQSLIPNYTFNTLSTTVENLLDRNNSKCLADIAQIKKELQENHGVLDRFPARTFVGSYGSPPSTISAYNQGNLFSSGHRPTCYSAFSEVNSSKRKISTTYCAATYTGMSFPLPFPTQAVCTPDSCLLELDEIKKSWIQHGSNISPWFPNNSINQSSWLYQDTENGIICDPLAEMWCEENHGQPDFSEDWDGFDTAGVVIFGVALILSLLGLIKKFNLFSLQRSWNSLKNVKRSKKEDIKCLHSLKVLSMFWIIFYHTGSFLSNATYSYYPPNNELSPIPLFSAHRRWQISEWSKSYWYYFMMNSNAVDTFFTIGGFLSAIVGLKKFSRLYKISDKCKPTNLILKGLSELTLRYFRFFPAVLAMLAIIFLLNMVPEANSILSSTFLGLRYLCIQNTISESFWGLLAFVNIWDDSTYMKCAIWLWYIEADFWLYGIALSVTIMLVYTKKSYFKYLALQLLVILIIFPVIYKFTISYICALAPLAETATSATDPRFEDEVTSKICLNTYALDLYYKPYARMSCYFIGFVCGYFWSQKARTSEEKYVLIKFSHKFIYYMLWILISVMFLVFIWLPRNYYLEPTWPRILMALYISCFREFWSFLVISIIFLVERFEFNFLSENESWNFPKNFLTSNFWLIPSKLNYSAYCIHSVIAAWMVGQNQNIRFYTGKDVFVFTSSVLIMSYFAAGLMFLLFEAPFGRVVDRYLKRFLDRKVLDLSK